MTWMQTHTGKRFDFEAFFLGNLSSNDIVLEDIIWALSHVVRYGGHASEPYTVGQHSVYVSRRAQDHVGPELKRMAGMCGLLHDATEAYLGDVVRPLKALMPLYAKLEEHLDRRIRRRFGLSDLDEVWSAVRQADEELLATEAAYFYPEAQRPASWELKYAPLPAFGLYTWPTTETRFIFRERAEELGVR